MSPPASGHQDHVTLLRLPPDPREVRTARRFVQHACEAAHVSDEVCDAAVLLTSEVVTNAFTHGRSEARLSIDVACGVVHVEVGDDNSRHPFEETDDRDALDGRGMRLVEAMARSWGVRDEAIGKIVWFDL